MIDNGQQPSELFRELVRLLPTARVEEYCRNGAWDKESMLIDIGLIEWHREQAGAPEPPPLDKIPKVFMPGGPSYAEQLAAKTAATTKPPSVPPRTSGTAVAPTRAPSSVTVPSRVPAVSSRFAITADDARSITDFALKWQLDKTKTKVLLSRCNASHRKWLMQHFNFNSGMIGDAAEQLEDLIEESGDRFGGIAHIDNAVPNQSASKRKRSPSLDSNGEEHATAASRTVFPPAKGSISKMTSAADRFQATRVPVKQIKNPAAHAPGDLISALLG